MPHDHLTSDAGGTLDFFSDHYWIDPYPALHQLRARSAAAKNTLGIWEILRYHDVESLFRDPRILAPGVSLLEEQGVFAGSFFEWWRLLMFQNEGSAHTRLRRLGSELVTREALHWTRVRTTKIANRLLDSVVSAGRMDVLADFAHIIPATVMCDLIGIPPEDYTQIAAWSDDVALGLSMFISPSSVERIDAAIDGLCNKSREALHNKTSRHNSDFIQPMLSSAARSETTEPEMVALLSNLLYAGHLTTKNLIGNGILALLRNPDQTEHLRRNPSLIKTAVEEFLRYDAPVSGAVRRVSEDFSAAGIDLKANELIFLSVLGANRDPARFANPDRLDIGRANNKHLSFGWGSHYCLGAPFARLEASVAIPILLMRCRELELDVPSLSWRRLTRMHGLDSLRVHFVHT